MFHVELASWGVFLPSEVRFRGILALSRAWFYNGQKQKCKFLKKPSWPDFQIFCGDSWGIFTKNGTNLRPGQFFLGFDPYKSLCAPLSELPLKILRYAKMHVFFQLNGWYTRGLLLLCFKNILYDVFGMSEQVEVPHWSEPALTLLLIFSFLQMEFPLSSFQQNQI